MRLGVIDVGSNTIHLLVVDAHVDHAQSHAVNLPKYVHANAHVPHSLGGCQKPLSISPACGWSSSTPPIPTSASAATCPGSRRHGPASSAAVVLASMRIALMTVAAPWARTSRTRTTYRG